MHYFQHNIGDYRRDTMHLTLLEHGVYRQLLDIYYLDETPIPTETEQVLRRLLARTEEEKSTVASILREYFKPTPKGWVHTRCDEEIAIYKGRVGRAQSNGKQGGRPKKTEVVILNNPEITQTKANQVTKEPNNQRTNEQRGVADKPLPTPKLSDVEWMVSLKTHYPHLNVESESRKMDAWLSTRRGKLKTRRFVVNWLNRIDAPISAGSLTLATSEHDF